MDTDEQQSKRQTFERLTKEMDQATEHTRNEIIRHYGIHFLPSGNTEPEAILQDLSAARGPAYGCLKAQGFHRSDTAAPLRPLGMENAQIALRKSLVNSVAHGNDSDPSDKTANNLCQEFFSLLVEPLQALYFVIDSYYMRDNYFESGLIAIDGEKVVYAWFEETD